MGRIDLFIRKRFPRMVDYLKSKPHVVKMVKFFRRLYRAIKKRIGKDEFIYRYRLEVRRENGIGPVVFIGCTVLLYVLLTYVLTSIPNSNISKNNDWVAFFGSMGGGLLTLGGVYLTISYQNRVHFRNTSPYLAIRKADESNADEIHNISYYHIVHSNDNSTNRNQKQPSYAEYTFRLSNIGMSNAHHLYFTDVVTNYCRAHLSSEGRGEDISLNVNEDVYIKMRVYTHSIGDKLDLHVPIVIHDIYNNKNVQLVTLSMSRLNRYPEWQLHVSSIDYPIRYKEYERTQKRLGRRYK